MKVSEFIKIVANSDLQQTHLADVGGVTTVTSPAQANNVETVLGFVQLGLVNLYTLFPLKISVYDDVFRADSEYDDPVVLPNSCLALQKVTDDEFEPLPVDSADHELKLKNKAYDGALVRTLSVNKYLVKGDWKDGPRTLYFHYFDSPGTIRLGDELPLPTAYHEALINFVGYRAYSTVKSVTPAGDVGLMYKQKFEDSVQKLKDQTDTYVDDFDHLRLWNKGFV